MHGRVSASVSRIPTRVAHWQQVRAPSLGEAPQSVDGLWRTTLGEFGHSIEVSAFAPGVQVTAEQDDAAMRFRDQAPRTLSRFTSRAAAEAEGYQHPDGIDPYHLVNRKYLDDDYLNPERPEFVMFDPTTGQFLGVTFPAPVGEHRPQFGGPLTDWHHHPARGGDLRCWDGALPIEGNWDAAKGACRKGQEWDRSPEMLHVWASPNAGEPFASETAPISWRHLRSDLTDVQRRGGWTFLGRTPSNQTNQGNWPLLAGPPSPTEGHEADPRGS